MNTIQRVIILAAIVLIVLSVLFPPYAAGKLPVGENIHSGIGYHPIWKPPTVEYAFNKVGFIFQLIVILLISSVMLFIVRKS